MAVRPTLRTASLAAALACLAGLAALAPSPARGAAATLTVRGAGFGHGVGMSQYGALGMAREGSSHREILAHYYTGTAIGSSGGRTVRVLVGAGRRRVAFSGATRAGGRRLRASTTYSARARGGAVALHSPRGRRIATLPAPLRLASSGGVVAISGTGTYRGAIELRPAAGGLNAINAVGIDDYLQGVVPVESPSSWPLEALKAQAVAARTYALTTSKRGDGFDQYADTRSQVYGGVGVERASTNQAVRETAGQVVTHQGQPVVTYFFSTSGGRTEDVENTSLGTRPLPWLKSVDDPADAVSPRHRWGPVRMSLASADRKLGSLVKGAFRGIDVVERGTSPRIVAADVIGTRGTTRVSGATLRAELGLLDTWAYFTSVSTRADEPAPDELDPPATRRAARTPANGGVLADAAVLRRFPPLTATMPRTARKVLAGRVVGGRGRLVLERRAAGRWRKRASARLAADGRYRLRVLDPGAYRVRVGAAAGPTVRVR